MKSAVEIETYTQIVTIGSAMHGIALCSVNGECVEPLAVYRAEGGGVRIMACPLQVHEGMPQVDLRKFINGKPLASFSTAEQDGIEVALRTHVATLDAVPIVVLKYKAYPVPKKKRGGAIGAVQCALHGVLVEPLLVMRNPKGQIEVQGIDEIPMGGGRVFNLRPYSYGIRLDSDNFTPELRRQLVNLVSEAVRKS